MIGENWRAGTRKTARIFRENDYVRRETAAALSSGKLVLPVLVDGAGMPPKGGIPSDIQLIRKRDAVFLRHDSFDQDMDIIEDAIFGRQVPTPITRWLRRRPFLALTLRTISGVVLSASALVVVAIAHNVLSGGRALSETLGSTGVVWVVIITALIAGGGIPLWQGIRR